MSDTNAAPTFEKEIKTSAEKYKQEGRTFSPFIFKIHSAADLLDNHVLWTNGSVCFYKVPGSDGFLPFGDTVSSLTWNSYIKVLLAKPVSGREDALAHPVGLHWVADDAGSGNPNGINYYVPIAPPGYVAPGMIWSNYGSDAPQIDLTQYWCVKQEFTTDADAQWVWSDAGAHFDQHNGSLTSPVLSGQKPPGRKMFLSPNTILSADPNISAFLPAKALIVDKCQASDLVNLKNIPNPDYNPQNPSGAKYWPGIKDAYILPCTAVEDGGLASQKLLQADNSPFYFIVNCPYWVCRKTFDTGDGATCTETVTIGTSETDSTDFKQTTSWTASVKVGFEAGGASAEASFSLTEEFELETDKSITTSTETTGTIELKLKGAKNVQFWQLFSAIRVYRSTGEIISEIDYGRSDNLILPEGVEKAETKSAA